jgi:biopolymer transport protein ExbD
MATTVLRRFVSPVTAPGPRLLRRVPLRFLRAGNGRGRRRLGFELPLVSFIDCLLCLVLFLLGSFSANADCPERQKVPSAENAIANVDAPVVAITRSKILLDGSPTGDTSAISDAGRLTRVGDLFQALQAKRELWKQLNPGQAFPGTVILQVDRSVPSLVVKSAFQTAAHAGYPNVSFLVRQR